MKTAQRFAFATAALTLVLIGVGVYVRASGSGLGCPDWPTCHGSVVPPNSKQSLIEFSHRFVASLVGLMVIGTALFAGRSYRHIPFIVWTSLAVVPLVGFQGILGAITVYRELPPEIVATHLLTAMVVLGLELVVAMAMYLEDPRRRDRMALLARPARVAVGRAGCLAIAWLAGIIWVGGYMSESGASTACSGWPACNGALLPGANDQEITHMLHRYLAGAFIVLIAVFVAVAWRHRAELPWAAPLALLAGGLYAVQVIVGALNVWYTFPDVLTVSHTVIAASVWATLVSAVILAFYRPAADAVPAGRFTRAGAAA